MNDLRFDPDTLLHADDAPDSEDMTYPPLRYDLRTVAQQQADSMTDLRLEVARLRDEVEYLRLRVQRMEGGGA